MRAVQAAYPGPWEVGGAVFRDDLPHVQAAHEQVRTDMRRVVSHRAATFQGGEAGSDSEVIQ